jgi:hypothetical protein
MFVLYFSLKYYKKSQSLSCPGSPANASCAHIVSNHAPLPPTAEPSTTPLGNHQKNKTKLQFQPLLIGGHQQAELRVWAGVAPDIHQLRQHQRSETATLPARSDASGGERDGVVEAIRKAGTDNE